MTQPGRENEKKRKQKICLRKEIKTNHSQLALRHLRQYARADPRRSGGEDRETTQEQQRGALAAAGVPARV